MFGIFLVIHVIIATLLIAIVLFQRSDQDGMGLGSGSGANFMTGRQSANLLTRATAILATAFIVNSLFLSILAANKNDVSLTDRIQAVKAGAAKPVKADKTPKSEAPQVPVMDEAPVTSPKPEVDAAPVQEQPKAEKPIEAAPEAVKEAEEETEDKAEEKARPAVPVEQ